MITIVMVTNDSTNNHHNHNKDNHDSDDDVKDDIVTNSHLPTSSNGALDANAFNWEGLLHLLHPAANRRNFEETRYGTMPLSQHSRALCRKSRMMALNYNTYFPYVRALPIHLYSIAFSSRLKKVTWQLLKS